MASATLQSILAEGGAIARRLGDLYEFRPQQLEMAAAAEDALEAGQHLIAEAGTGVGKSFAYLLPAIHYAVSKQKRVVISTHTISLQEQLIEKDIPLIQSVYPDEFTAVLVKGRSNYLCRRRLQQARGRQGMLFDRPEQLESLWAIEQWAQTTTDGSLTDLPGVPEGSVWDRVCAEHGNCLGKKCQFYQDCFWQAAKRRMTGGSVLVVNHALFFSDLALRAAGVNYLPKYDVAILDEAHTIEDVAGQHFGLKISETGLRYQLRLLYDPRRGRGLLSTHGSCANDSITDVIELHAAMERFFERCMEWQQVHGRGNGRIHTADFVENDLSPKLHNLSLHLREMLTKVSGDEEVLELSALAEKISLLGQELSALVSQTMPDAVYWMETGRRAQRSISLQAAPVDIAQGLRMHLFEKMHSVIMCSATLCTAVEKSAQKSQSQSNQGPRGRGLKARAKVEPAGGAEVQPVPASQVDPAVPAGPPQDPRFEYIQSRLGAAGARTLWLGSPFDYSTQATLYIEADMPEPADARRFTPAACEKIVHYVKQTRGGAFVLFTSYSSLIEAANRLRATLEDLGSPVLIQGQGAPRKILLERFRATPNAVLFGTSSFWQGIDVRGEALRNVIIVKLPFAVPDEPVVEARLEMITRRGGNPFMEYSVPEAIIKLKQGFGRLIRSKSDRGIVVILDSRIKSKRYGKLFLQALPSCKLVVVQRARDPEDQRLPEELEQ